MIPQLFNAQMAQYATPTVTGESNVAIENGIKCYLPELKIAGNTTQQTYDGYNLFDINNVKLAAASEEILNQYSPIIEDGVFKSGGLVGTTAGAVAYIPNPTSETKYLTFTAEWDSTEIACYVGLMRIKSIDRSIDNGDISSTMDMAKQLELTSNGATYTISASISNTNFPYCGIVAYSTTKGGLRLTNIQISTQEGAPYEPYVGSIPAPNPYYPQDVINAGDNGVWVDNIGNKVEFTSYTQKVTEKYLNCILTSQKNNPNIHISFGKIDGTSVASTEITQKASFSSFPMFTCTLEDLIEKRYSCRYTICYKDKNKTRSNIEAGFGIGIRYAEEKKTWHLSMEKHVVWFDKDSKSIVVNLDINHIVDLAKFNDAGYSSNTKFTIVPVFYLEYSAGVVDKPQNYDCAIMYEIVEGEYDSSNFPIIHIPPSVDVEIDDETKTVDLAFRYAGKYSDSQDWYDYLKIDTVNKTVKYYQNTAKYVCDKNTKITDPQDIKNGFRRFYISSFNMKIDIPTDSGRGYCSHLPTIKFHDAKEGVIFGLYNGYINIKLNETNFSTSASVKTWMETQYENGTPVTFVIPYKETIHDITDPQLCKQLLGLVQNNGTTIIKISNTNNLSQTLSAKYLTHS